MILQVTATGWALYLSEIWYSLYMWGEHATPQRRLYAKARAMVVFDRAMDRIMKDSA